MSGAVPDVSPEEALLLAHARLGHAEEVTALLDSGINIECKGLYGTPLVETCRAEHCTQLHILTAQVLLKHRANVDATDWFGASALIHAAIRCSVLPEIHVHIKCPAPGIDGISRHEVDGDGKLENGTELDDVSKRRASARYSLHRSKSSNGSVYDLFREDSAATVGAQGDDDDGDAIIASTVEGSACMTLQRPRFASDGRPRHVQLVTMLLNNKCNVRLCTRNGVNAIHVLAASPSTDAVAILDWVVERALGHAPPCTVDEMNDDIWKADAAGANVIHYAAYAANVDALHAFQRIFDDTHLRKLAGSLDVFGRSPLDVLNLYPETTILMSSRTRSLKKHGLYPEVPFESRRREFRTLLMTMM